MEPRRLFPFLPLFFALLFVSIAAAQSASGDAELALGAQAYKQAKYDEAIQHFERAAALDPTNVRAQHYLATAYAQQYIPGVDTPENNEKGERAIAQFRKVIDLDPSKAEGRLAVKGIAYVTLQMKRFDEAKDWYRRATELDPDDPEPYYSIAVIDWTQTYQARQEERAKLGIAPDASLPAKNKEICALIREKNLVKIQEGIDNLNKALQLRPDYDDAMAYMNLMYRERADVQCDDPATREADLKTADDWVDKTMAVKKARMERGQVSRPKE